MATILLRYWSIQKIIFIKTMRTGKYKPGQLEKSIMKTPAIILLAIAASVLGVSNLIGQHAGDARVQQRLALASSYGALEISREGENIAAVAVKSGGTMASAAVRGESATAGATDGETRATYVPVYEETVRYRF